MPEVISYKPVPAGPEAIWDYVHDMNKWATFIMGYQGHEAIDDRRSKWTVKGELGALARVVQFEVLITEWVELERVRFTITGLTERFDGEGTFLIGLRTDAAPRRRPGRFFSLLRKLFRRRANWDTAGAGEAGSGFTCTLRLQAGGMTGPVVNAMLEPLMRRAADDLAGNLATQIVDRTALPDTSRPQS
ncbi:SRPBCC family protein [Amycolatopsis sp. K13G38]|uniref:SRPBCC family protein n=1 Tax=Amycolatopsis acididurans TaxID=2724524 RepID=A0ABX1J8S2_9PSEU|nr:SRPBCC family protein [Amycolatopsis acididurans]NKQ56108.1 SRPBCC family protein [Amycolatopsis acididurans]